MQAERTLSDLVGDIYDAALEPARFVAVFAEMARLVGVSAAGIKFQSVAGDGVVQYWTGLPETFEQAFVAEYWRDDIWTARSMLGPVGQVKDGRLAAADPTAQRELMRVVGGKAIGRELVVARPSRLPPYGVIAAPVGRHLAYGLGGGDATRGLGLATDNRKDP